jgi:hypothetical protein
MYKMCTGISQLCRKERKSNDSVSTWLILIIFCFFQRVVNIHKCPNFRVLTADIILTLARLKLIKT